MCVMTEEGPVPADLSAETQGRDCQLPYPVPSAWPLTLPGFPSSLSPPEPASVLSAMSCAHSSVLLQGAGLTSMVGTMPRVLTSLGLQESLFHLPSQVSPYALHPWTALRTPHFQIL